jgi:hypothetical protein
MHSWNEWLAWLCSFSNAHMQQRTAVALQHAADCAYDNRTATTQRCTAGMKVGMALLIQHAHAAATAVPPQHAARSSRLCMITVQPQSKMHSWNEWLAWFCLLITNTRALLRTAARSTQQIVHDNRTATIKDVQLERMVGMVSVHSARISTHRCSTVNAADCVHDVNSHNNKDVQLE